MYLHSHFNVWLYNQLYPACLTCVICGNKPILYLYLSIFINTLVGGLRFMVGPNPC